MAEGLHVGDPVGDVIEKTKLNHFSTSVMDFEKTIEKVNKTVGETVKSFYSNNNNNNNNKRDCAKLFVSLCSSKNNNGSKPSGEEELLVVGSTEDEDCRKKRCVDRYDSSESSDSGVAVLSCTDCSGSSTASSDITDPGSPFSTASNHSEDSGGGGLEKSQSGKMPPAQSATHHLPWPWIADEGSPIKRPSLNDNINKILYTNNCTTINNKSSSIASIIIEEEEEESAIKQSPSCLSINSSANRKFNNNNNAKIIINNNKVDSSPTKNNNINNYNKINNRKGAASRGAGEIMPKIMQQGKITEYFKTQLKNGISRKDVVLKVKSIDAKKITVINHQLASNNNNNNNTKNGWRTNAAAKKLEFAKIRKLTSTIPRKILPAPSKIPEAIPASTAIATNMHPFTPTVTLTAVGFPPNLTYLHTKAPKPPDNNNIFVPHHQFTTTTTNIGNENANTFPIMNRNPSSSCLNVIHHHHHHPVQKIATLNNFNCVKLNTTVVPIVNLNALPSRLNNNNNNNNNINNINGSNATNIGNVTTHHLSVDTAVPTVLPARPKIADNGTFQAPSSNSAIFGKHYSNNGNNADGIISSSSSSSSSLSVVVDGVQPFCKRTEEPYRTEECQTQQLLQEPPDEKFWHEGTHHQTRITMNQKSPSPADSDSGISSRESLEISVDEPIILTIAEEPKKSPILSQPKTIRFPAVQHQQKDKEDGRELGKSPPQSNDGRCRWDECAAQFDTSGALLEHLQVKHVISQSQANQEQYVCLWRGCKVHGRTSCSISWLERHVLAHAGTKPFRCIVDGCGQRFNSQLMLERHVNNHFNTDGTQNTNTKKSVENGPVKLFKRNGRIIRFRRQPWSARMFDFIDSSIMEGVQHQLLCITEETKTMGNNNNNNNNNKMSAGDVVNLKSEILAKRTDFNGNKEILIRWHPINISPDEWIFENEFKSTKSLTIPSLLSDNGPHEALSSILFPCSQRRSGEKHRRKPLKSS